MTYKVKTAKKDLYSIFGGCLVARKGEKYLDKGFGFVEKIQGANL